MTEPRLLLLPMWLLPPGWAGWVVKCWSRPPVVVLVQSPRPATAVPEPATAVPEPVAEAPGPTTEVPGSPTWFFEPDPAASGSGGTKMESESRDGLIDG